MIQVNNISKHFGKTKVINNISFSVKKGEVVVVLDPSGSGKTTLLRCLNFLEQPDTGSMRIGDTNVDIGSSGKKDILNFRRNIAIIFQSYNLFNNKTALQNVIAGSGVIAAAALHLEAAIPNFLIHEHHPKTLIPGYVELCEHNYQPVKGFLTVPELPGIGQELTKTAYQKADRVTIK